MDAFILDHAESVMASSWIYLIIAGVAAIDSFFPVVPSEALMITAGVFANQGRPTLLLLIAAGAAGAFVGDHISYGIGRVASGPIQRWFGRKSKRSARLDWAKNSIAKRGGMILVVARYIPGGRTITTLTMGVVKYPLHKFSFFDLLAGISWATYSALIGYFGGKAFENEPLKGLLLGLGVAVGLAIVIELVRKVAHSRKTARLNLGQ